MGDRLDLYWKLLGSQAAELEVRVAALAGAMTGKDPAWYGGQRSRYGDPFGELAGIVKRAASSCSSRAALEREIRDWVEENRGPAVALFALDRAERQVEPGESPDPSLLSLPGIRERTDERTAEFLTQLQSLLPNELRALAARVERDFAERRADLREEANRLVEDRVGSDGPLERLVRSTVEAEIAAEAPAAAPRVRAELKARADHLRTRVREARRFQQAANDVRSRWIDLQAERAALRAAVCRSRDQVGIRGMASSSEQRMARLVE